MLIPNALDRISFLSGGTKRIVHACLIQEKNQEEGIDAEKSKRQEFK